MHISYLITFRLCALGPVSLFYSIRMENFHMLPNWMHHEKGVY